MTPRLGIFMVIFMVITGENKLTELEIIFLIYVKITNSGAKYVPNKRLYVELK